MMLAGRYDLRTSSIRTSAGGAQRRSNPSQDFPVQGPRVAQKLLTEIRGLPEGTEEQADRVQAAIERSRGNPLKLQLFSEILLSEPSLTGDSIRSDVSVEVEYLIRRVVLRIGENQKDPQTGEIDHLHKQLRWVLRYGVVPRQLTLDFLLADPIRKRIEREARGRGRGQTRKGLENLRTESPNTAWIKNPGGLSGPLGGAQEVRRRIVLGPAWPRAPERPTRLVFTPDVVYPMRGPAPGTGARPCSLRSTARPTAYFRGQGGGARSLGPGARVRGLREVVYHDFQRRRAAGAAWRDLLTSEEFRDNPTGREIMAEEVTGRAYLADDDPPRPILRKDKTRMIAPGDPGPRLLSQGPGSC